MKKNRNYLIIGMILTFILSCASCTDKNKETQKNKEHQTYVLGYNLLACDIQKVKNAIANGADVNAMITAVQTNNVETVLTLTAMDRSNKECFDFVFPRVSKELLSKKNSKGKVPLDILLKIGLDKSLPNEMIIMSDYKAAKILENGATFDNTIGEDGRSRVSHVFEQNRMLLTIDQLIINNLANEFKQEDQWQSPVFLAIENSNFDAARKLIVKNDDFLSSEILGYTFMEKGALWSKKDSLTDEDRENIQFCFEYMSKIFKAKLLDTIVLGSIDTFWLEYFFTKHTLQGWELSPVTLMNLKDGSLGVDIERILLRNGLDPTLVD